jgi:phosphoglycerate dehydrogenase-like enzyme
MATFLGKCGRSPPIILHRRRRKKRQPLPRATLHPGNAAQQVAIHTFHDLPNVLMTPPVSGWTEGTLNARALLIAENIGRVAQGETPLNLVVP